MINEGIEYSFEEKPVNIPLHISNPLHFINTHLFNEAGRK